MTFAEYMINSELPEGYKIKGTVDKKVLTATLTRLAKERPDLYSDVVHRVKKVGDMFATNEGISVGLDDITPDYKTRNALLNQADRELRRTQDPSKQVDVLLKYQKKALDTLKFMDNSLKRQVESGSRGKPGQLLKTVFSPVVAKGKNDIPQNYLIRNSYSEGLTPGEFWVTAGESRRELATTQLATALPGDTSKQITATLNNVLVTKPDCRTTNGLAYSVDDSQITGRYEAGTNVLITDSYARSLKKKGGTIKLRSPLTCLEHPGVCQKCFGNTVTGSLVPIGTNIGLRAAHALSEPLTQMILSSKHGGQMAKGDTPTLDGTMGFRQLLDIPHIFKHKAVLATKDGKVTSVQAAPQGGTNIHVGNDLYYAEPKRQVSVKQGHTIIAGQTLTDGIPHPGEVVQLKGLGAGREYMKDTLYDIYDRSGIDMDKRHIEILVKQDLNHMKVNRANSAGSFVRGDTVPYNKVREYLSAKSKNTALSPKLVGKTLGDEYFHHTAGTVITPEIMTHLKDSGVKSVKVSGTKALFEAVMRPLEQIPLLSKDWVSRLAHRRLKNTIVEGAAQGWESRKHSESPYPALLYGDINFGSNLPTKGVY